MKTKMIRLNKKIFMILFLSIFTICFGYVKGSTYYPMYFTGKAVVVNIGGSYGGFFNENFSPLVYSPSCMSTFIPNSSSRVVRYDIKVYQSNKNLKIHILSANMQGVYIHSSQVNTPSGLIYQVENLVNTFDTFDYTISNCNLMLYEVDILYPCSDSLTSGYFTLNYN